MSTVIDILHWLPQHIANIDEYQQIRLAYNKVLTDLQAAVEQVYANRHFDTMDATECTYWETLMGITLDGDETLDERRMAIKGNNASSLPFNEDKFNEVLTQMVGAGYYTLTINAAAKTLVVTLTLEKISKYAYITWLMRQMAPADMSVTVSIIYNRHREFITYTHTQLAAYTHDGLRTSTDFNGE